MQPSGEAPEGAGAAEPVAEGAGPLRPRASSLSALRSTWATESSFRFQPQGPPQKPIMQPSGDAPEGAGAADALAEGAGPLRPRASSLSFRFQPQGPPQKPIMQPSGEAPEGAGAEALGLGASGAARAVSAKARGTKTFMASREFTEG